MVQCGLGSDLRVQQRALGGWSSTAEIQAQPLFSGT